MKSVSSIYKTSSKCTTEKQVYLPLDTMHFNGVNSGQVTAGKRQDSEATFCVAVENQLEVVRNCT
jgi:hypothetical protein